MSEVPQDFGDPTQFEQRGNANSSDPTKDIESLESSEDRLDEMENEIERIRSMIQYPEPFPNPLLAVMTSTDGKWTEATIIAGDVATVSGARMCSSISDPSRIIELTGNQTILLQYRDSTDNYYIRLTSTANSVSGLIPVNVATDGGGAGGPTSNATFTYTVTTKDTATTIGTMMSPEMQRPKGLTLAAHIGNGFFLTGTFTLEWVDEVPSAAERDCT